MKKLVLIILILTLLLLLVACGGDNADNFEIIEFGGISWLVLDAQDGRALLLSEYLLDRIPYHNTLEGVTWETSDIRRWLNNEFYNRFTAAERTRIAETYVINNNLSRTGARGGNDTVDKIFLLSIEEMEQYFGGISADLVFSKLLQDPYSTETKEAQRAYGVAREMRRAYFETGDYGDWWLRSPEGTWGIAALVWGNGRQAGRVVNYDDVGIRPAMWVYL